MTFFGDGGLAVVDAGGGRSVVSRMVVGLEVEPVTAVGIDGGLEQVAGA